MTEPFFTTKGLGLAMVHGFLQQSREPLEIRSEMGYRVLTAVGGQEVLDREGNRINPLFTDLVMPGPSNGLMLAEEMRRRALEVLVLLTTGYNEDLAQSERAPGMDVLGKPYPRAELADRVRGPLAGSGRTSPRRQASEFGAADK